jgi:hypothetical protein
MTAGAVVDSRIIRTVAEHVEWHSIDHATCNRCIYCQRYLDEERRFREAVARFHATYRGKPGEAAEVRQESLWDDE